MLRLSSTIDQVTVYRQGALVTRVVECSQPDSGWPDKIALTGLPLALQDQTLRVALEFPQGGAGVLANDLGVELEWQEGVQGHQRASRANRRAGSAHRDVDLQPVPTGIVAAGQSRDL